MAARSSTDPLTRDVKTEEGPCRRRSPQWDRPNMSGLRIVLLGRSGEVKSKVGNIILGREVLSVKDQCERAQGRVNGRPVALINTPDLLDPELPDRKLFYQIEKCVTLSAPGPHAFLLVLECSTFTNNNKKTLKRILGIFSDESFKYSVALVTEKSESFFNIKDSIYSKISKSPVHKVVEKCSQRCHTLRNTEEINFTQVTKLMEKIEKMVRENRGGFLSFDMFKEPESAALGVIQGSLMRTEQKMERKQKPQAQPREQQQMGKGEKVAEGDKLNLVLFGSSVAGKTSAGNAILGQRESSVDSSSSSVCERREGEVCGRLVTVVEMPTLCESQLSASTVSRLCASFCGPGVHAFLLVTPAGPLTDDDKAEITKIQEIFGSRVTDYMMALFTHESPSAQPGLDFLQQNTDTRELLKICSDRFCVFNNQEIENNQIVPKLLEAIEEMNRATESCFSLDMYWEAQLQKVQELEARHKTELEEKDRKIRKLEENINGKSLAALGAIEGSLMGTEQKMERKQNPQAQPREQQQMGEGEKVAVGDRLNLVLFGSSGAGKTSAGNAILGQRESCVDSSSSSVCERREGEVCGRLVTLVEMPADVTHETRHYASLCGPGVHAFLLVTPAGPLTDEDKVEITKIQEIFGSRVTDYMMILFTHESPTAQPVRDFLQQNKDTQELLKMCGNRFCVVNNGDIVNNLIVPKLLKAIEEMNRPAESCFSLDMFWEAQLEKKDRKIRELEETIKEKSLGKF